METGKLINSPHPTYRKKKRQKFIHPSKFSEKLRKTGGKLCPQDKGSTRLQELSLINNTYFGAIPYDILLDMKLNYTISKMF